MDRQFLSHQKERKKKVEDESLKAKERYMQYWKEKIGGLYMEQAQSVMEISKRKEERKRELGELQI